jgi:putative nucleotidyltransferase with HDIG domain
VNIPDYNTCYELLHRYEVPEHIIDHSCQVALVSLFLGECLQTEKIYFEPQLLLSAALLHDIAKMESVENGQDHAALGAEWLLLEGYPEVADIVLNHVILKTDLAGPIAAKEIVYYADKRVRHTDIVSVCERLQDLRERYGVCSVSMGRLVELENLTLAVEKKLFAPLHIRPDNILKNSIKKNLLTYMKQTNI